jgi:hypothetical protein
VIEGDVVVGSTGCEMWRSRLVRGSRVLSTVAAPVDLLSQAQHCTSWLTTGYHMFIYRMHSVTT